MVSRNFSAVLIVTLVAGLFLFGCLQGGTSSSATPYASSTPYGTTQASGQGTLVFAAKDAAADMGSVSSVKMTFDNVQVHSATQGWVTVSSTPQTVDLVQLKASGQAMVLANAKAAADTYDQVRMHVSSVVVADASGSHDAKLPSNDLKINAQADVKDSATATETFDVLADESLHLTGDGKYVMAPVMQVETRDDASAQVNSDDTVVITGGSVVTSAKVGMDVHGNIDVGLEIPADANVTIDETGSVMIGSGTVISGNGSGRLVGAIGDPAANMGAVTSVKVTVDSVQVHSAAQGWVTVSSKQNTFDLIALNASGKAALVADANISAGTYDQVRMEVSKVVVADANGSSEAKLPSGDLKIVGQLVVTANSTSTAFFDFFANESLHVTGNGKYIMTPVLRLETRENASADEDTQGDVNIHGGSVLSSLKVGMDVNGNVGEGSEVSSDANLTIDANGDVMSGGSAGVGVGVGVGGSANGNGMAH